MTTCNNLPIPRATIFRSPSEMSQCTANSWPALPRFLDGEGQHFLGFLREGGRRLATLISDLLAYTRAGIVDAPVAPVDSSAVLTHCISNLAEAIRESNATVTYDSCRKCT